MPNSPYSSPSPVTITWHVQYNDIVSDNGAAVITNVGSVNDPAATCSDPKFLSIVPILVNELQIDGSSVTFDVPAYQSASFSLSVPKWQIVWVDPETGFDHLIRFKTTGGIPSVSPFLSFLTHTQIKEALESLCS